jgi:hypothetical protein
LKAWSASSKRLGIALANVPKPTGIESSFLACANVREGRQSIDACQNRGLVLTHLQRRILEFLSEHDRGSIFELDKAMNASREEFRLAYRQLHEQQFIAGLVTHDGPSRWQLTSRGRNYIRAAHRTL